MNIDRDKDTDRSSESDINVEQGELRNKKQDLGALVTYMYRLSEHGDRCPLVATQIPQTVGRWSRWYNICFICI